MGRTRKFYPDFIFWLKQKATGKLIVKFIDPKGGEHQNNPSDKIVGFEKMFQAYLTPNNHAIYEFNLHFYNPNPDVTRSLKPEYKKYWNDNLADIFR
jgi:hypothetical protein